MSSILRLSIFAYTLLAIGCSSPTKRSASEGGAANIPAATATPSAQEVAKVVEKDLKSTKTEVSHEQNAVTCTHGSEVRTLAVESKGTGCSVNYTKAGKTTSVANSSNGMDYCTKTLAKTRSKLESAGFTCKQ